MQNCQCFIRFRDKIDFARIRKKTVKAFGRKRLMRQTPV
jgi:hypothetical protein